MRVYRANLDDTLFGTVAGDIYQIEPAAGKPCAILQFVLTQESSTTNNMNDIEVVLATTAGTGGTARTAMPTQPGLVAAGATILEANTVDAAGTVDVHGSEAFSALSGYNFEPSPDGWLWIPVGSVGVFRFPNTVKEDYKLSGFLLFGEVG